MQCKTSGVIVTLIVSLLTAPLTAAAQPAKVWRIGYLTPAGIPRATFIEQLRARGEVDGHGAPVEVQTAPATHDARAATSTARARVSRSERPRTISSGYRNWLLTWSARRSTSLSR